VAYTDLRDWIRQLDKAGELKRIDEAVSLHLEMAACASV
jgi:UbiD family decarboxylase